MVKFRWHKPGLVVGLFVASLHALWAISVAWGLGQIYMNWIFPLHFINNLYSVMPFNLLTAVLLVIVSFIASHIATCYFVWLWNHIKVKGYTGK